MSSLNSGSFRYLSASLRSWLCLLIVTAVVVPATSSALPRRAKRQDENDHYFIKPSPKHDVKSGHSLRLRCQVNKEKYIRYHWLLNRREIQNTSRRFQDGRRDLFFRYVDPELDSGEFRCVATNTSSHFDRESNAVRITFIAIESDVSVELVSPAKVSDIRKGSTVRMRCKVKARPKLDPKKIIWYYNFISLKGKVAANRKYSFDNGDLVINSYTRGNAGTYRCRIIHPAGLVVASKPLAIAAEEPTNEYKIDTDPSKYLQYYKKNGVAEIRCPIQVLDKSAGSTTWKYRPGLVKGSAVMYRYINAPCDEVCVQPWEKSFALQIQPRSDKQRNGYYGCSVSTRSRVRSKEYVVEVREAVNPPLTPTNFGLPNFKEALVAVARRPFTLRVFVTRDRSKRTKSSEVEGPDPMPQFQWQTPYNLSIGDEKGKSGSRIRLINNTNLYFSNVLPSDAGFYRLTTHNLAGRQEARVNLIVAMLPIFTKRLSDITLQEGATDAKDTTLTCNVDQRSPYPVSRISWVKDGKKLEPGFRILIDEDKGTLTFKIVRAADAGKYKCVVSTRYLQDMSSKAFRVDVKKLLTVSTSDSRPFLERGFTGKLACRADGDEPLTFAWFRRVGKRIVPIKKGSHYQMEREKANTGLLLINGIRDQDNGTYICSVTDAYNKKQNITMQAVVGEKPTIRSSTTKNISTVQGRSFRLNCVAHGDPQPKVSWTRRPITKQTQSNTNHPESLTLESFLDDDPLTARRYLFNNGTLLIRRAVKADEGIYQCVLGHAFGMVGGDDIHVRVAASDGTGFGSSDQRRRSPLMKTILIVVGCALAYLGIIIALTVYCSIRMARKRRKYSEAPPGTKADLVAAAAAEHQRLMPNGEPSPHTVVSSGQISPSASMYNGPFGTLSSGSQMIDPTLPPYPRGRLIPVGSLGRGEFGEVQVARAPIISGANESGETEVLVTCKYLQYTKERRVVDEYFAQMEMFNKLDHRSVSRLVGTCLDGEVPCLILEYCAWGDLKQFLRTVRRGQMGQQLLPSVTPHVGGPDNPISQPLSYSQRMHICSQVANGMEHISNLRYIHKDLAARNILISPNLDVKISHLGLCQSTYAEDYFPMRHKGSRSTRPVPIRWMPPEVILNGAYSAETDVWSYAIFVYEVLSLGETPLRKHSHSEILTAAAARRLSPELPPGCTPELQSLLLRSWSENRSARPSFSEISVLVGGMVVECDI